ncbi:MAG: hypothetical protein WCR54_04105 [Clostridia bacterium]
MNNFLVTLKMEFRGKFNLGKNPSQKAWGLFALNLIFTAIIYGIIVAGIYFISSMILQGKIPMKYEFLTVATLVSMLVQLVSCTGRLIKVLYHDTDNELLIRFPLEGRELFLAKAAFAFFNNLILSVAFTLPFYVFYGVFSDANVLFYFLAIFTSIVISFIPFFISNLIAVPVMYLNNLIYNKFGLKLAGAILLIIIGFSIYMLILRGVLEYYQSSATNIMFSDQLLNQIKGVAKGLIPASLFANVISGEWVWQSLLIIVAMIAIIGGVSMYLGMRSYLPTVLKTVEKGREAFEKKTKNKKRSIFGTILKTEFLTIFRSFNYSFQYLAMAISAPFMVFFCNNLAVAVGDHSVGGAIIPGLTILVMLIFDTIIVSFASTTVSRNGDNFYLTKIIPVSYKVQLATKVFLYLIVAGGSSLVSCISTWIIYGGEKFGNNIGFVDVISIFFISFFIIIFLTCIAIMSDMKKPTFDVSSDGDLVEANKNVTNSMILGIFISVMFGLFAMVFTYIPMGSWHIGINAVYIVLNAASFVLALVSVLVLVLTADKKYEKIVG